MANVDTLPKTLPKLTAQPSPDAELGIPSVRLTPIDETVIKNLGLLANLAGSWKGKGFNLVARPDFKQNAPLFLELNQTEDIAEFFDPSPPPSRTAASQWMTSSCSA